MPDRKLRRHHPAQAASGCFALIILSILSLMTVPGCHKDDGDKQNAELTTGKQNVVASPRERMNAAIRSGDLQLAWDLRQAVLTQHPEDSTVLVSLAKVAFARNERDVAADLMIDAVNLDSHDSIALIKQTVIALTAVGRVFDAIDLLEIAVAKHPEQSDLRRWLFDFLSALEQHDEAQPHGRRLVMNRKIDFALLLQLSNTEERKLENDSTDQMAERNPDDKRYLIARAKVKLDRGKFKEARQLLDEISRSHPQHFPTQLLRGRLFVDTGDFDRLPDWASNLPTVAELNWQYWMVLGDWARNQGELEYAARCYWESIQRNQDVMQIWAKLAAVLNQLDDDNIADIPTPRIQRRANLLSALYAQKDRFERSNRRSKSTVVEIVTSLRDLGRLWEAEAWAALGIALQNATDDSPEVKSNLIEIRKTLVSKLQRDTPWQSRDASPELAMDLSRFESLTLTDLRAEETATPTKTMQIQQSEVVPRLVNQASDRGLDFFGRTRDDLNQPGISIYAELGCGGGAIDYDLDGWIDIYLMDAGGTPPKMDSRSNGLFRNLAGPFQDTTQHSGSGDRGFGQGVAVGDVNGDGFPDLYLLNYGINRLLINNGDGTFTQHMGQSEDASALWSTSGAIADLDQDGLPEIAVLQYCAGFRPVTEKCTDEAKGITKSCAPIHFPAELDTLLKVTDDNRLMDVTDTFGFSPSIPGRGLGLVVGDLDQNPGLEILVANDMTNNHFYSRAPTEDFQLAETGMLRGLAGDDRSSPQASMGIAVADMDLDGDVDFYVTNFENEYNTFYDQRSRGTWQDRTAQQNLIQSPMPMVGFGCEAIDIENDGIMELLVTNGHVHFPVESDDAPYEQPMQLFRRTNSRGYQEIRSDLPEDSYLNTHHVGRSLWTLDVNRDGLTDVAVTHQTEPVALLVNQTEAPNHWIAFQLSGVESDRNAIGTKVVITRNNQTISQTLVSGDGFQCSNERVLRFGLGDSNESVAVSVVWPSGREENLGRLETDSHWLLVEGQVPYSFDPK